MRLVEETARALAAAKARETELSLVVKASRVEVNVARDQASIASSCVLSLDDEQ